jgi:hypothetical protein
MICAIGLDSDRTIVHFLSHAHRVGREVAAVNLRAVAAHGSWRLAIPDDGESYLDTGDERVFLRCDGAYYNRMIDLSSVQCGKEQAIRWRGLCAALTCWLAAIDGTVVNRPLARIDNSSKPFHAHELIRLGFRVPETLVSSDQAALVAFARQGPTILKAISGVRADASEMTPDALASFHSEQGPIQLQRRVIGDDLRVHVVGSRLFAERITTTAVDYRRSANDDVRFTPHDLPDGLSKKLVKATATFGLCFAGWDFKVAPDGEYWCLEANPMPGYDSYDRRADGAISEALLGLLS